MQPLWISNDVLDFQRMSANTYHVLNTQKVGNMGTLNHFRGQNGLL